MDEETPVNKGGRPRKEVNYETVKNLRGIQATDREIAAVLGMSETTFRMRKKEDPLLREALETGEADGKISLRREMWRNAMNGDSGMQRWLSKNHLGMKDKVETSEGPTGGNVVVPERITNVDEWLRMHAESDDDIRVEEVDETEVESSF